MRRDRRVGGAPDGKRAYVSEHAGGALPPSAALDGRVAPEHAVAAPPWSAWRAVIGFGVVSLFADAVYEGARSITGPLLASLGASALLVV